MKILLSAYACEPHKGSEQGVGWNWAKQIARFHEVLVITRANNREVIEKELNRNPIPNLFFSYVDLPRWLSFWKRGSRGLYAYYILWQILAYSRARKLQRDVQFDLVHHVTFGNNWLPTLIWLLPIPFVWGPIGGAESVPKAFRDKFSIRWKYYERLRDIIQWWVFHVDPIIRLALAHSSLIIARTGITGKKLAKHYKGQIQTFLETGVTKEFIKGMPDKKKDSSHIFKIIMVGRLIHWKGFDLAIEAFGLLLKSVPTVQLEIIGSGPEMKMLEQMIQRLDLCDSVCLAGFLPHEETLRRMVEADVFLSPSLKDAGAWGFF